MGHVTSFIRAWRLKYSARESGCLLHMNYNAWQTMLGHVIRDRGPAWVKFWQVIWPRNSDKNSWNDDKRQQMGWNFNSDEVENKYNSKIPAGTWLPSQYKKWWVLKFWPWEICAPPPPAPSKRAPWCHCYTKFRRGNMPPKKRNKPAVRLKSNMYPLCSRMSIWWW